MSKLFDDFQVGDEFVTYGRTVTEADVAHFAGVTGDINPLHLDEEYGTRSRSGAAWTAPSRGTPPAA